LAATILALMVSNARTAYAGESEWATVGKVLTGIAAGVVLANPLDCDGHASVTVSYRTPMICQSLSPSAVYARHGRGNHWGGHNRWRY